MSDQSDLQSGGKGGNTRPPSSRNWCFTFNNYNKHLTSKNECLDVFVKLLSTLGLYVLQEETGEDGTPHLQGVVKFHKACRPMETVKHKEIHWEKCRNWDKSVQYCSKLDTRTGEFFTNIDGVEKEEALEYDEPYGWQLEVVDLIKSKPDKRKIYWFWEESGRVGKSSLCKYLCIKHKALIIGGKANDMKTMIMTMDKKPKICVMDIPRCVDHVSYSGIEEIKNGCFCSPKYESGMCVFNSPHLIIFSNMEPDYELLSADRWVVKKIEIPLND